MILSVECRDEEVLNMALERAKDLYDKNRTPCSPMVTKSNYTNIDNHNLYYNMFTKLYSAEDISFYFTNEYFKNQNKDYVIIYIDMDTFEDKCIIATMKSFDIKFFHTTANNFDIGFNMLEKIYFRKET